MDEYNMTFEEAQDYISKRGFDIPWNDCDVWVDKDRLTETVAKVLKWADNNPAARWISVEDYATDELPPLIDEKDPYGESVHVLFFVELDGIQFISKGCFDYDSGMWHALETDCSYCKEQVTHWMPLPKPPKKGGEQ